jgi:hypothetical protein
VAPFLSLREKCRHPVWHASPTYCLDQGDTLVGMFRHDCYYVTYFKGVYDIIIASKIYDGEMTESSSAGLARLFRVTALVVFPQYILFSPLLWFYYPTIYLVQKNWR